MAGGGRTEQEAREDTIAAFELALLHVGCNPASTPLWQKYLDYIKSWEERSPLDKGNKMTAIRKARGGGYVRGGLFCLDTGGGGHGGRHVMMCSSVVLKATTVLRIGQD